MSRLLLTWILLTTFGMRIQERNVDVAVQCFAGIPSITACLDTPFKGYWEANGGLPVFGYPLTGPNLEQNQDLKRALVTQWTERNRLEIHPENTGPYSILLGRMGDERLRQLGRSAATVVQESGPQPGCLWFDTTKHNVCNQGAGIGFLSYWQAHGLNVVGPDPYNRSLQLFGLPLTTPEPELNEAGEMVVTQWFERARFEWHPDKPDEFKVLLGLLGNELRHTNPPTTTSIVGVEVNQGWVAATGGELKAAQPHLVRYNAIMWSSVEATRGARNWASIQAATDELAALGRSGTSPLVIVRSTPAWAQQVAGSACGPIKPAALDAFADFMYDLVTRYSVAPYNVHNWELGNEPDVGSNVVVGDSAFGCWGNPTDPYYGGGAYGEMLKRVYPRIKQADAYAQVGIGGLLLDCDPTHPPAGKDCQPATFLEGIVRSGADAAFDFVNYHAYSYWSPARQDWDLASASWKDRGGTVLGKLDFLQSVLQRYGVVKPIIMNEGSLLCYPGAQTCPSDSLTADQANYAIRLYTRAWAHGLAGAVWYTLNGPGWRLGGLLDANQAPRPAYQATVLMNTLLRGATFMGPLEVQGGEGYLFRKGSTTYSVLWTNSDSVVNVLAPVGIRAQFDAIGQRTPASAANVQIGFAPVIIEAQP